MDAWILPTALNLILGILAWFLKNELDNMKNKFKTLEESTREFQRDLSDIRQGYVEKEDFRDFKQELYKTLDRNHQDIIRQLQHKPH